MRERKEQSANTRRGIKKETYPRFLLDGTFLSDGRSSHKQRVYSFTRVLKNCSFGNTLGGKRVFIPLIGIDSLFDYGGAPLFALLQVQTFLLKGVHSSITTFWTVLNRRAKGRVCNTKRGFYCEPPSFIGTPLHHCLLSSLLYPHLTLPTLHVPFSPRPSRV